jgi:glyoxylase-like metal-dependent hydrolase (beta-lactamase superfamily II)
MSTKRVHVVLAAAVLALSLATPRAQAPAGGGQAGGQGQGQGQDVQVKANQLAPNFYALQAPTGLSTVGVLTGPDGVLMVDSGTAALTEKIVAAIKGVSASPIRFLINTHLHGDHTGGNQNFGKMGVTILSRDQLRMRFLKPNPGPGGAPGNPAPAPALPVVTYDGPVTIHMNGEEVQLIPVRSAHTDGDTMVKFPKADVIMSGDFYRSLGYPNLDRTSGGTLQGMLDGLELLIKSAGPATRIVPGHGEIVDKAAVTAHRNLIIALRDKVAPMVAKGMTLEQVNAAKPTAEFDAKVTGVGTTGERFIGQLYAELQTR